MPKKVRAKEQVKNSDSALLDHNRMQRVFTNLIKNAFDSMPEGLVLRLSKRVNGEFLISFADTGFFRQFMLISKRQLTFCL